MYIEGICLTNICLVYPLPFMFHPEGRFNYPFRGLFTVDLFINIESFVTGGLKIENTYVN